MTLNTSPYSLIFLTNSWFEFVLIFHWHFKVEDEQHFQYYNYNLLWMFLQILCIRNLVYRKYFRALHLLCSLLSRARVPDTCKIPHRAEMCIHSVHFHCLGNQWQTQGLLFGKSKILFVSSFFEIQIMVCIVSNPSFKLYSNAQDKNLLPKLNEGIFL